MILEVREPADLPAVVLAHQRMLYGDGEDTTLEIVFAAGDHAGPSLALDDDPKRRRLALVLRGPDAGVAVLRAPRLSVGGGTVTVRDLVLDGAPSAGFALTADVTDAVTLERVALLGLRMRDRKGRGTRTRVGGIRLSAHAPGPSATVRGCSFLDNTGGGSTPVLAVDGRPGKRFSEVRVQQTLFAGNTMRPAVVVGAADRVVFEACALHDAGGAYLASHGPRTSVVPPAWSLDGEPVEPARVAAWLEAARAGRPPLSD